MSIEVRIRHEHESRSASLMTWDATDLDNVIPSLARWGVYHDNAGEPVTDKLRFSAQIMVDEGAAFFEVILHDPEDA
jgi:DNA gyrase inhibitor GyrI